MVLTEVACIPVAEIVVVLIPPDATICFPEGTAMPPFAVINSPACIVVVDTMLFADNTPVVIVSDTLTFPIISRDTVGAELPMPILAPLPLPPLK